MVSTAAGLFGEFWVSDTNPDLAAQEVDEELRREQLRALWKAYGKFIIGGAVGVVLAVGGYQLSEYLTRSAQEEASGVFAEALDESSNRAGAEAAAVWQGSSADLDGGYAALAGIRAAQALAADGMTSEALEAYDAISATSSYDAVLRDYAALMAALLVLDASDDLTEARSRFVTLSLDSSPWKYSAKEQLAYIDLKEGRLEDALTNFSELASDGAVPQSISLRAQQFRDMIENQMPVVDVADNPAQEGAEADVEGSNNENQ